MVRLLGPLRGCRSCSEQVWQRGSAGPRPSAWPSPLLLGAASAHRPTQHCPEHSFLLGKWLGDVFKGSACICAFLLFYCQSCHSWPALQPSTRAGFSSLEMESSSFPCSCLLSSTATDKALSFFMELCGLQSLSMLTSLEYKFIVLNIRS